MARAEISYAPHSRKRRIGLMAIVLAATLAGCVVGFQQPWDPQGSYLCEDGKAFTVQFTPEGSALVAYGTQRVVLPPTSGATDAKFTDGRTTLYLDGPRALLEAGGQVVGRSCVKR